MPIKINSFGGIVSWYFRKHFSQYTSKIALETAAVVYKKRVIEYIEKFNASEIKPLFRIVNIETINRCNGACAFCPANVRDEKRPLKRMDETMFRSVVDELCEMSWEGWVVL